MQPDTAKRLLDALEAGRLVMEFTRETTFEDYEQSALLRSAVERQFEIIGESLGKAAADDPLLSEIIEGLPRIVGLRNRLIHGYDSVDHEIVWDIVRTKIPPLVERLKASLENEGYPTS